MVPLRSPVTDFSPDLEKKQGDSLSHTSAFSQSLCSTGIEAKDISVVYVWKPVAKYEHCVTPLHIPWINSLSEKCTSEQHYNFALP